MCIQETCSFERPIRPKCLKFRLRIGLWLKSYCMKNRIIVNARRIFICRNVVSILWRGKFPLILAGKMIGIFKCCFRSTSMKTTRSCAMLGVQSVSVAGRATGNWMYTYYVCLVSICIFYYYAATKQLHFIPSLFPKMRPCAVFWFEGKTFRIHVPNMMCASGQLFANLHVALPPAPPPLASPFTTNLPMGFLAFMPTIASKPLSFCTSAWFFLQLLLEIRENTSCEVERNFRIFVDVQNDVHCSTDEWEHKNYSDLQFGSVSMLPWKK